MEHSLILNYPLLYLIPLLPLVGFLLNGLVGHKLPRSWNSFIGCATVFGSLMVAVFAVLSLFEQVGLNPERLVVLQQTIIPEWIVSRVVQTSISFALDPLSGVLALVVCGIGFLIHLYSDGYMAHDRSPARYFAYLNLFTFAMLMLILGDNLLVMFVGWEGVGLCSYLLIGFWFEDDEKAKAGKKAFIVNRIGDFGFLLGIFTLLSLFGTLSFEGLRQSAAAASGDQIIAHGIFAGWQVSSVVTMACLFLFVGATGKSAQIPLYVWLPDAMAGPTPVSALIHAATMVTAGVFMVARLGFLYAMAPIAGATVALVGAATALFAATIGITQNDIKKVLAYSTVSQLGYMFIGVGVGAYGAGVFHLTTHAFFKACLFLCAGSVIHGMHEIQDIRQMGGLARKMPYTFYTFLVSTLAIAGIPPLSGFFSKDEILWKALSHSSAVWSGLPYIIWAMGALAALCTAFYMFRLLYLTFTGPHARGEEKLQKVHESPSVMTGPLVILAGGAAIVGFLGLPAVLGPNLFHHWLEPVFSGLAGGYGAGVEAFRGSEMAHSHGMEWLMMFVSIGIAALGIFLAHKLYYQRRSDTPAKIAQSMRGLYGVVNNKYYIDEIYNAAFVKTLIALSVGLWQWVDAKLIDGLLVNGSAKMVRQVGQITSRLQGGEVQSYLVSIALGLILLVLFLTSGV